MKARPLIASVVIGGSAAGLLSAFPIVYVVNFLFFAWIWGGAFLAVLLYRGWASSVKPSQGAVIGFLAGAVAAFVAFVFSNLLGTMMFGKNAVIVALGAGCSFVYVLPMPLFGAIAGAFGGVLLERR